MNKIKTKELLEHCLKNKKSLTPTRVLVIHTLSNHLKPKSAYELQEEINNNQAENINISTIYRVLEFWMKLGLVHKISSINKFLLCMEPKKNHTHMLNFCTSCEKVIETCSEKMELNLTKSIEKLNLSLNKEQCIEIPVICSSCS